MSAVAAPAGLPARLRPQDVAHGGTPPPQAWRAVVALWPDSAAELRLGLAALAAGLATTYLIAGAQIAGRLTTAGEVLLAIGVLQAGWATAIRRGSPTTLTAGAALNLLLVAAWATSRAIGLPGISDRPEPIGLLDALCALDSLVLALAAGVLALDSTRVKRSPAIALLPHLLILLAAVSLSALAAGHTHSAPAFARSGPAAGPHFYCRLL